MLPPLNTPIAHDGSATWPVDPDTAVFVTYPWGAEKFHISARHIMWEHVSTYTIITRAPADRIAEDAARIAALETALSAMVDEAKNNPTSGGGHVRHSAITKARATLKGSTP